MYLYICRYIWTCFENLSFFNSICHQCMKQGNVSRWQHMATDIPCRHPLPTKSWATRWNARLMPLAKWITAVAVPSFLVLWGCGTHIVYFFKWNWWYVMINCDEKRFALNFGNSPCSNEATSVSQTRPTSGVRLHAEDRELRAEYLRMVKLQPKPKPKCKPWPSRYHHSAFR